MRLLRADGSHSKTYAFVLTTDQSPCGEPSDSHEVGNQVELGHHKIDRADSVIADVLCDKFHGWTLFTSRRQSSAMQRRSQFRPATAVLQDQAKRWMDEQRSVRIGHVTNCDRRSQSGKPRRCFRRLAMLANIPVLDENPDANAVADALVSRSLMPESARLDALHVATAALAGVQYLLTQNCKHIANAHVLPRVYRLLNDLGLPGLLIATPIEFLGGADDDESDT